MRLLITGAGGLLGRELTRLASQRGHAVTACDHAALDVTDAGAVAAALAAARPEVVVNCAAYTAVDRAESEPEAALRVNREGAGVVARACAAAGSRVVHLGSDYVFAGAERRPRREDDPLAPGSAYGRSKLAGEQAVAAAGGAWLVVRSAWLYGRHGANFVDTIRRKAAAGEALKVVDDQIGSPTWAVSLAEGVLDLIAAGATGVVHCANRGAVSWYDLARAVVSRVNPAVVVQPIATAELARPASRPAYSALDTGRFTALTGRPPSDWESALERYLGGAQHDRDGPAVPGQGES